MKKIFMAAITSALIFATGCSKKTDAKQIVIYSNADDEAVVSVKNALDGNGYEGKYIGSLTEADGPKGHRNLGKAIADAALTYNKYVSGEVIEQPPTPFQKASRSAGRLLRRKAAVQK